MTEARRPRGKILVVEDEAYVRESLGEILTARGFETIVSDSAASALETLKRAPVDAVLTDLKMPGLSGLDLVRRLHESSPGVPVLVLTGHGNVSSAVECMRSGASDYILKPADPEALELALEKAIASRALSNEVAYLRSRAGAAAEGASTGGGGTDPGMPVGAGAAWMEAMRKVRAAAPTDSTVLLVGESGTGKEVLARLIHRLGGRSSYPYVRVNCAAVPLEMWESEFFGHRKGAYTGATADREGRFKLAHRGTLFMDEIGTMPMPAQAKILRVLQDGEFDRLGDEQPTRVDVRIVAATNSDLEAEIAAGRFRQDLYYRLNVVRIDVPPLRQRAEDIPLLTRLFTSEIAARLGRPSPSVAPEVMADLRAYPWPGNVRELRNVLERALIFMEGDSLSSLDLPPVQGSDQHYAIDDAPGTEAGSADGAPSGAAASPLNLRAAIGRKEKEVLIEALRRSGGIRKEAARLLGIDQRNLSYYLRKHGVDPEKA